jgi:hypothetical protein
MNLARALLDLWRLRVVIVAVVALLPAIAVSYPISLPSKLESWPYEVTVIGLAAETFVFAMGCALILGIVTLVRKLRMPEQNGGPRSSSSTTRTWPRSRPERRTVQ